MTAKLLRFPARSGTFLDSVARIGYTGEPTPGIPFSEELQEELLYVLDAVFDSNVFGWLTAIVRVTLTADKVGLTPSEALDIWVDRLICRYATEESEQFA